MGKTTSDEVRDIVEVIEQIYSMEIQNLTRKLENIKRINYDSLVSLIESEKVKNNISSRRDIVLYIDSIILD